MLAFVYLVLAAQYESFILPLAVILSLPGGRVRLVLHAASSWAWPTTSMRRSGLVMLVGLLGKNAVLIVEFAVQTHHEGATVLQAAIEGAKARFRPILMTSFAFIAGLIPLVERHGAGRRRQPHHRRVGARRHARSAPSSA